MAMPVVLWVAFWSSMMRAATYWQEATPDRTRGTDRRDRAVAESGVKKP